jgi:glyoxylase-like metal-dependent hydrolase (beta-lactamase superfamily II)
VSDAVAVRRVLAPNPGRMTGPGTNTWLVGRTDVTVIDPGPDDEGHVDAVVAAGRGRIRRILLTHTHPDHWPAAPRLAARTGAPVLAFGSRDGLRVDGTLADGDVVEGADHRLRAVHTPGHASNHLCYLLEDDRLLFSGDHVMEGSTVLIRPPDGDMAAYLEQLVRLRETDLAAIAPAHGSRITRPHAVLDRLLAHRRAREAVVLRALRAAGPTTVRRLVPEVYADVDAARHDIALHSLHAHLRKLAGEGRAEVDRSGRWRA